MKRNSPFFGASGKTKLCKYTIEIFVSKPTKTNILICWKLNLLFKYTITKLNKATVFPVQILNYRYVIWKVTNKTDNILSVT